MWAPPGMARENFGIAWSLDMLSHQILRLLHCVTTTWHAETPCRNATRTKSIVQACRDPELHWREAVEDRREPDPQPPSLLLPPHPASQCKAELWAGQMLPSLASKHTHAIPFRRTYVVPKWLLCPWKKPSSVIFKNTSGPLQSNMD